MNVLVGMKPSRFPARVYLEFDSGYYFPFFLDDFITVKLARGQEHDDQSLQSLAGLSLKYLAYEAALRQVALSPKTENIIRRKLRMFLFKVIKKYKYPDVADEIPQAINYSVAKLNSQKLLDQKQFVESFIRKNLHKSKKEIIYLLSAQGVDVKNDLPPDLLDNIDETETVSRLINKKITNPSDLTDNKTKTKLIAYLVRKGFSLSIIKTAIDDMMNYR